jgi:O-antigen ligase
MPINNALPGGVQPLGNHKKRKTPDTSAPGSRATTSSTSTTSPAAEGFRQGDNRWIVRGGIASLFIYAAFWLMDIEISQHGEALMVVFFLLAMFSSQRSIFLSEPVLYLLLAWILFQFGVYQWSIDNFPELKSDHIREARVITNVFMFAVVAWWLGGNTNRVITVIALSIVGYLIGATFQDSGLLHELEKFRNHQRLTLGYRNWEHASVYSAFVFLALLILQERIVASVPERFRWPVRLFIYLALIYSAIAIIATQTRATWLGLAVTAVICSTIFVLYKLRRRQSSTVTPKKPTEKITLWGIALILIGIVVTATSIDAHSTFSKRLSAERDVINKLLEGKPEEVQVSSVGIRIKTWDMALDWIEERPLTGWGPQSRKTLLMQSDLPQWVKVQIRHLHNSYIELLVAYGLIGLSMFTGLFSYVWFRAWQAWRYGYIPNDIMLFSTTWSVYWLVANSFESYVIYSSTGSYINAIVAGMMYTYHLKKRHCEKCVISTSIANSHTAEVYHPT